MKDNGKVIVSLLAGATAGVVAGLLLAPETGEDARAGLRRTAQRLGGSLGKLAQDTLDRLQGAAGSVPNPAAGVSEDRAAADRLFDGMNQAEAGEPGDLATPAGAGNGRSLAGDDDYGPGHRHDLDYDGDAGEGRHRAGL